MKKKKKVTHRMGENICKWSHWQGINHQNIQTAHAAQYISKKKKNPIRKWEENLDSFPKSTYRWPTSIRKDSQHC